MSAIAVLGAGSWGTALSLLLARNGHTVYLWDNNATMLASLKTERTNSRYLPDVPFPDSIVIAETFEEALGQVNEILMVVPSHAFGKALSQLKPYLKKSHRIIWATKGLEMETGRFLHQVLEDILGKDFPYAVLSGPSFAREVGVGVPTAVAIASNNTAFLADLKHLFTSESFGVEATSDVVGVQLGGVVKNVLAVAVGISDGVGYGANTRAALMTKGLAEMIALGQKLGAELSTLTGLAGCGDLILTCTDNQSRNRRFGLALAEGLTQQQALDKIGNADYI